MNTFATINPAYNQTFRPNRLSLGVISPLESYAVGALPNLEQHLQRVQQAERLGFAAIWLRDIIFNVPSFGDTGQGFDPFVYLGFLAAHTQRIALGVGSIILPLRHPAHVAKAAASVDALSGGRLLLGIASGDRPEEYPALKQDFANRSAAFRHSYAYIRHMGEPTPRFDNAWGQLNGELDMLPKPHAARLPLLITGASQQAPAWVAENGDGWITYPRAIATQERIIHDWRSRIAAAGLANKPAMQSLYIDLQDDPNAPARPIHLGFSSGINALRHYLKQLEGIGINHVALNLRFNQAETGATLERLAAELLPDFPTLPND